MTTVRQAKAQILQRWITLTGDGTSPIVQTAREWLDLAPFADAAIWLEVVAVTNPPDGSIVLSYETSPSPDDYFFRSFADITLAVTSAPLITQVRTADDPLVPLARWLRWKLAGTASGPWSVTFRIMVTAGAATPRGQFTPQQIFGDNLAHFWASQYSKPTSDSALWVDEGTNPGGADATEYFDSGIPRVGSLNGRAFPLFTEILGDGIGQMLAGPEITTLADSNDYTLFGAFASVAQEDLGQSFKPLAQQGNFDVYARYSYTDARFHLASSIQYGEQFNDDTPASVIDDGKIHTWVFVVRNGDGELLLDGVSIGTATGLPAIPSTSINPVMFGGFSNAGSLTGGVYLAGIATRGIDRTEVGRLFDYLKSYVGHPTSPTVTSVDPDTGAFGDPVSIAGTGFTDGMRVFFRTPDMIPWYEAPNTVFVDSTELTCDVPTGLSDGPTDILVFRTDGLYATLPDGFDEETP